VYERSNKSIFMSSKTYVVCAKQLMLNLYKYYLITNSMVQDVLWAANSHSESPEISSFY
jgi:hypothetical protein